MTQNRKSRVAIVNYGVGNLFSVKQACDVSGLDGIITSSANIISAADAVILPGVGAFKSAMESLTANKLIDVLVNFAASGRPFIGICLGMQLLMDKSYEFGVTQGLGLIKGEVKRLENRGSKGHNSIKVPHVGWAKIEFNQARKECETIWYPFISAPFMYFVHSYYTAPSDTDIILTMTQHGENKFCSTFEYKNIFGCQYHPERSGPQGLKLYEQLSLKLNNNRRQGVHDS